MSILLAYNLLAIIAPAVLGVPALLLIRRWPLFGLVFGVFSLLWAAYFFSAYLEGGANVLGIVWVAIFLPFACGCFHLLLWQRLRKKTKPTSTGPST